MRPLMGSRWFMTVRRIQLFRRTQISRDFIETNGEITFENSKG